MASEQDLQNDLNAIQAGVNQIAIQVTQMAASIAALQAAGGVSVMTQPQLDALDVEAKAIVTALSAIPPAVVGGAPAVAPAAPPVQTL